MGAIETTINNHPKVKTCIINKQHSENGTDYLVCYVVCEKDIDNMDDFDVDNYYQEIKKELIQLCKTHLASFMIPSGWMFMDSLLHNKNGKVDRKRLPRVDLITDKTDIIQPTKPYEKELLEEWIGVIKRGSISITHDFFSDLGGNSLLGMTLVSKMQKRIGKKLRIGFNDLLEKSTIQTFAKYLSDTIKN